MNFKPGDRVRWHTGDFTGTVSSVDIEYLCVIWDHSDQGDACRNAIKLHTLIDPMDEIDPYEVDA